MRQHPWLVLPLAIVLLGSLAAGPVRADEGGNPADQPVTAEAPDPGAVTPEPYDPNLARLNKGECRRVARQILQYTDVAARANDRGDELWEQSTAAHLDRLEARWNTLCANEDDTYLRLFNAALTTAGRLALKYFTMGYFD